ncbi:glutamate-1-semialdehyde 2,1-aminomutase [Aurantibacillus circumpalustris]|uniref:glutamate-1-semialdehyde 2,1-aminomutase n=1 Tax=Aurantibacillus circumpalustris TaxID=3036359 RepID=UPI00295B55BA|nr:glutamate-1-semialdehyde 2,1-aminomutase [Aurantibacillus circumpalustris]
METKKSAELFERAKNYFPGGVNSPVRAFRSVGGNPLFIEKGKGSHIWDADGNEYIDYCCSWGPLILGHAHDGVLNAVDKTMRKGTSFGAPTQLENELAELILLNNSFIKKIRFVSSGTEAVMSAIRLARGFTKRNKILKFEGCYHGHVDSLLVKAGSGLVTFGNSSSAGVPESFVNETITVQLNNKSAVEEAFLKFKDEIACVIIEPVPANNGLLLQGKEFLTFLREICTKNKTLLIFDEVISGFRMSFCGAAGLYNIQPDIITYGKIIGGGFPVGAYGANKEIMACISPEGNVYQAGTLSGNPVAMTAGIAQLSECLKENFYADLEKKTKYLVEGINKINPFKLFKLFHLGSIFWIAFTEKEKISNADDIDANSMSYFKTLYHSLLESGVYLGPSGYEVGFVSSAHTYDDLDKTVLAFKTALNKLV